MSYRYVSALAVAVLTIAGGAPVSGGAQTSAPNGTSAGGRTLRQVAYVKPSNTRGGMQFGSGGTLLGSSVALSRDGNTLAVGAPDEDSGAKGINGNQSDTSAYGAGAVYVFTRSGNTWVQQAYVKASNTRPGSKFGNVVALSADGNTMAVAAYFESSGARGVNADQNDESIPQAGAVYVFTRSNGTWTQQAYIKASNTGEAAKGDELSDGDQFGFSLALSADGNTLAVGAITEDSASPGINGDQEDNSAGSAGAVYVFTRNANTWSQQAYVKASNPGGGDLFGYSVALTADGNLLVVGAFDEDGSIQGTNERQDDECGGCGAVYVFNRANGAWRQTAYLKATNGDRNDSLGVMVAVSDDGNTIAAAALDEDCLCTGVNPKDAQGNLAGHGDWESDTSTGALYVFVRSGNGWAQQAYIKASNTGKDDWFGSRFAMSGDGNVLAVGAQLEDSNAQGIDGRQDDDSAEEAGAVYLFVREGSTWTQRHYVKASNNEAFDEFGSSLSLSRDGRVLAVGARGEDSAATGINGDQADNSAMESGAVYIFSYE